MKVLAKTKELSREKWLELRRMGIAGSDAPIVLALNKYRSILHLWKDKMGLVPIEENTNEYTYFGNVMEPVIKKEFTKRTGLKVRAKNAILQSEEYEFMLADVDGLVKEADGTFSLFEAKTANEFKREIWEKKIPDEYMAQVQHYLCVTGLKKAYVCAIVGGNSFYCHEIFRDEEYIKVLIEKEREFWACVKENRQPVPDGAEATVEYLNNMYPESNKNETELPFEAENLVDSYLEVDASIKKLTTEKNQLANQLKNMLMDNEKGVVGGHIVKWVDVKKKILDTQKVKEVLGDTYDDYLSISSYRKFSVA